MTSPVLRNQGAGRRWVKRYGSAATLRQFAPTGEDAYGDPTDYGPTETPTFGVVVESGGAGTTVVRDGLGNERRIDANVFIPDDVAITMPEDDPTLRDLPEIDVRGISYLVAHVRHRARPGLQRLMCEMQRRVG